MLVSTVQTTRSKEILQIGDLETYFNSIIIDITETSTFLEREDLLSTIFSCYVSIVSCFFGLSSYFTRDSSSVIQKNNGEIVSVFVGANVKLFASDLSPNWKESTNIVKILKYENVRKSVRCEGIAPFQADRRMGEHDEANSCFENAPKI